jgi:hypothetical protein
MTIKFQKYYVTDGVIKVNVRYSLDNMGPHGSKCVAIFAKEYGDDLGQVFPDEYKNDSDHMSDYCVHGRVILYENHQLYAAARARVESNLDPAKVNLSGVPAGVAEFAAAVEAAELETLIRLKLDCDANRRNVKTSIKPGKKYTKVDVGGSGRYMIDSAGNIFGIKAYGVVHTGKRYGTLDNPVIRARH